MHDKKKLIPQEINKDRKVEELEKKEENRIKELMVGHDKTIKGYSQLLQVADRKTTELKVREELRNEISQKMMNLSELIATYNEKILNLENNIRRQKEKLNPQRNKLKELEVELRILDSLYMELNSKFDKEVYLIKELMVENIDSDKYAEIYKRKNMIVDQLLEELRHKELELLYKECDILDTKEEMKVDFDELEKLEVFYEYLKNEQAKQIFIGTHKVSSLEDRDKLDDNTSMLEEVIDIEIYKGKDKS